MATIYVTMKGSTLVFADTEEGLSTPSVAPSIAVECQIIDAHIATATTTETASATLCADAVDTITGVTRTLELTAFQDWTDPDGMAWYLEAGTLDVKWFELELPASGAHRGQVTLAPLQYGGAAGSNLQGTVSLPVSNHSATPPTFTATAATAARATKKAAATAAA